MLIEEAYQINLARDFYTVMQGGRPEPMPRQASGGAAVRFMEAVPGEVVSITGVEEARELPGVLSLTLKLTPGDTVRELRSSWDRVGSVMARGADSLEALRNAEAVVAAVGIETTPATAVN
ncbi:hypothetical protein ACFQ0T_02640 [Kitasatospora gansuensis]